jgi:hypothetical protein
LDGIQTCNPSRELLITEISFFFISDNFIPFSGGGGGGTGGTGGGGGGGGGGSDSDDTSENSTAGGCTPLTSTETVLSSRSPRPSKYNFYVELGKDSCSRQFIFIYLEA